MDLRELKQIAIEQDRLYREACMEKRDLPELVSQWEYAVHVLPMQMVALVDHVTELENRVNGTEAENIQLRRGLTFYMNAVNAMQVARKEGKNVHDTLMNFLFAEKVAKDILEKAGRDDQAPEEKMARDLGLLPETDQ